MHAIHIVGGEGGPVFLGKGSADPAVVRARLDPSVEGKSLWVSPALGSSAEMNLRYLMTLDSFKRDLYARQRGEWWLLPFNKAVLAAEGALRSSAHRPITPDFARSLRQLSVHLSLDSAMIAAALGTSPARMSRLMNGVAYLTATELAVLRWWCHRLGREAEFDVCFSLECADPAHPETTTETEHVSG